MSIFTTVINSAISLYRDVEGGVKFSQIIGNLYGKLPSIITGVLSITGTDDETKIRQAWEEFDLRTGIEAGAVDVFRDIPPEDEEKMMDGFIAFGLGLTLWAAGFYGTAPSSVEFNAVLENMSSLSATNEEASDAVPPAYVFDSALYQQLQTISVVPEKYSSEQKSKVFAKALMLVIERVS